MYSSTGPTSAILLGILMSSATAIITGKATCDDEIKVYSDGILIATHSNWRNYVNVSCADNTVVIGIECVSWHEVGGIKAYFDNGISTDATWKCANEVHKDWNKPGFNTNSWHHATVVPRGVVNKYWGNLDGKSDWIWTLGYRGWDRHVFCRKELKPTSSCSKIVNRDGLIVDTLSRIVGTVVHLRCPPNYTLFGVRTLKCTFFGWDAMIPTCLLVSRKNDAGVYLWVVLIIISILVVVVIIVKLKACLIREPKTVVYSPSLLDTVSATFPTRAFRGRGRPSFHGKYERVY